MAIRLSPGRIARYIRFRGPTRLPTELSSVVDLHISDKYKHLADKHAAVIGFDFANDLNCRSTNGGTRKELVDRSFIWAEIAEIAEHYDADIIELTIFRLQETNRESDRG